MLIGSTARSVLMYGSLGFAAIGILILMYARPRWPKALAPMAMIPLGLIGGYWGHSYEMHVLVLTDSGGVMYTEWKRARSRSDFPIADGTTEVTFTSVSTWVINHSSRPVRVESVSYGMSHGVSDEPDMIPPGRMANFYSIDNIGPTDHQPSEVTDSVGIGMATRYWLTWD